MTNKEKEKNLFKIIKESSKAENWKFNSYFIFKEVNSFFFGCDFYFSPKKDNVSIVLSFKPMVLDDLFWDITKMPENKQMPLSFRSDAAFKIKPALIYKDNIVLENPEDPSGDVSAILSTINNKVQDIGDKVKTIDDFIQYVAEDEDPDYNTLITCYISKNDFEAAKENISLCRSNDIHSGYGFDGHDFYDMAEKYIKKTERGSKSMFNWKSIFFKN